MIGAAGVISTTLRQGRWSRLVRIGKTTAIVIAALLMGCARKSLPRPDGETVRVERRSLQEEVAAVGSVEPVVGAQVNVGPRISGVLDQLQVRVGDIVKKGQLLAVLDHRDLDAALAVSRAQLREAVSDEAVAVARARRRNELATQGLLSVEDDETAEADAALARARVAAARALLRQAEIRRSYAWVYAPINGTVTAVATREGESVAASFAIPTFVTIVDLTRLQVEALVDEADIGRVAVGQDATFTVDAFPDETFPARVSAIVPVARVKDNVVTYSVLLTITGGRTVVLRPQLTASLSISTGQVADALMIPTRAVRRDAAGHPWILVSEGGRWQRRDLSLGDIHGDMVRLKAGAVEGDVVSLAPDGEDKEKRTP